MAAFEAFQTAETESDRPRIQLNLRWRGEIITVDIARERRIDSTYFSPARIPVFYRFEEGTIRNGHYTSESAPRLIIIAGPGVSIRHNATGASQVFPLVFEIYRVQDPKLVPLIGGQYSMSALMSPYFIDLDGSNLTSAREAAVRAVPLLAPLYGAEMQAAMNLEDPMLPTDYFDSRFASVQELTAYQHDHMSRRVEFDAIRPYGLGAAVVQGIIRDYRRAFGATPAGSSAPSEREQIMNMIRNEYDGRPVSGHLAPPGFYVITPRHHGVDIWHPYSTSEVRVRVPVATNAPSRTAPLPTDLSQNREGEVRFSFQFPAGGAERSVHFYATPGVRVSWALDTNYIYTAESDLEFGRRMTSAHFLIFRTRFHSVPFARIDNAVGRFGFADVMPQNVETSRISTQRMAADIALGSIPIIGDAMDIGEFLNALLRGHDRWGRPVGTWELAAMGLGSVIGLIPIGGDIVHGVLRSGAGLVRNADAAIRLAEALRRANLSTADREFLLELSERLKSGRSLTNEPVETLPRLRRIIEYLAELPCA